VSDELATLTSAPVAIPAAVGVDILAAFLAGRNPRTLAAYDRDLADFARFLGAADARAAVALLLGLAHGDANACALGYRAHLAERGLQPATIARRLAALRSVVTLARTLGRVAWALDVPSPKAEPYRDTAGPGDAGWRAMLDRARAAAATGKPKGVRDLAVVRLLHDLGLRRGELAALDLAALDLGSEPPAVEVVGKGKTSAARLTLPEPTAAALAGWIQVRGSEPGPLFTRLDRAGKDGGRLTDTGVYLVVRDLGRKAGLSRPVRPHGLRHEAITRALDRTGGDVRTVQRFSRHADPRTLMLYDDRRRDAAGDVARLVAGD
jgi:integrase/recombinase XerC